MTLEGAVAKVFKLFDAETPMIKPYKYSIQIQMHDFASFMNFIISGVS